MKPVSITLTIYLPDELNGTLRERAVDLVVGCVNEACAKIERSLRCLEPRVEDPYTTMKVDA